MKVNRMNEEQTKAALSSDCQSQAAYVGRITQTETIEFIGSDGALHHQTIQFPISWDTMKKMLSLVRDRAGL